MDRKLIIGLSTLVFLFVLYFINTTIQKSYNSKETKLIVSQEEDIYKIVISANQEAIEIARYDSMWTISGNDTLDIKESVVSNFFEKIYNLEKQHLVTQKEDNWGQYGVSPETGTHLAFINKEGETIEYFVFGRSEGEFNRCFVRVNQESDVYLANQNILYQLQTSPTFWGSKPEPIEPIEPVLDN